MIKRINLRDYAQLDYKLFNYLDSLKAGQSEVFRTPFWNKLPMPYIVKEWMKVVTANDINSKMPGLFEIEVEQSKKVGPYSVIPPSAKRMESLLEYWEPVEGEEPISDSAVNQVIKLFKTKLRPYSREQSIAEMRLNTSAGLPYYMKRREALRIYERTNWEDYYPYMAIWGTRVQPGGPSVSDEKVRSVFMMPFSLNVKEGRYYYPLIHYMQEKNLPWPVNTLRWTEERITHLFDTKPADQLVVNTDFTSFDQHFRKPLQDAAYKILMAVFQDEAAPLIDETFRVKYTLPLLISENEAVFGDHGMGSGSTGTNPDENLSHKSLQYEAAEEAGEELSPDSLALGDDGILTFKGITADAVIKTYTKHGLVMNESKQYVSANSAKYLQRYYHVSYRDEKGIMLGVYPTFRALGRLMAQERFQNPKYWGPRQVTLRALSILEGCNNHPLFETFVNFVAKGDKYDLGRNIPNFFDTIEQEYEEYKAQHDLETYTQRNEKTSIKDWRVVKYLLKG
nr:MAG: RNA-dependent RNA-polymerase [Picobirnavirus sp.]